MCKCVSIMCVKFSKIQSSVQSVAILFRWALRRTRRRARANWTLTIASLCRRADGGPACPLPRFSKPRHRTRACVTFLMTHHAALRPSWRSATGVYWRVYIHAYVYVRLCAGRARGRPAARYFHSILLAPARSWPLDAPLLSLEAPSDPALLNGGAGAPSSAWHRPRYSSARRLPLRLAPRSNLNYHFTLPFERTAAAATAETQAAPRLAGLPFIHSFFTLFFLLSLRLSLSLLVGERSFSRSMRSPTVRARARAGR